MGNQSNKQNASMITPSQSQLQIICESQQGFVAQSLTHPVKYFIRELSFSTYQQLHKILPSIHEIQQNAHPTLTSLLHIQQTNINNMCGSMHKLRLIFQYSMLSINDEVQARRTNMRYFQYGDACRIVIGCVKALAKIQTDLQEKEDLVKSGVINRVFVNPQRILIMDDGIIKLVSNLIISPYDRFQHKHNCYYSPEKLYDFDFQQDQKSTLFQLGITMLHILTLTSCKQLYNGFEVKQDQIDLRIFKIWQLYHDTLLCQILSKITRTFRNFRIGMKACEDMVQFLRFRLQEKQQLQKIRIQKERQYMQHVQPVIQRKFSNNSEKRDINQVCQRIQSQISEQFFTQQKQNDNKQNYMNHSNRNHPISSLKYSSYSDSERKTSNKKTLQKLNLNINISNKAILNKQSLQLPSFVPQNNRSKLLNISAQKQSCVITPQSPFYNIALISSNSFVSPRYQQQRVNKCKQSYLYGNQLGQGLIQIKSNQISSPIQILNQMQENKMSQLKKKPQTSKFEWKRTQFNKKYNKIDKNTQQNRQIQISAMESVNQLIRNSNFYNIQNYGKELNQNMEAQNEIMNEQQIY